MPTDLKASLGIGDWSWPPQLTTDDGNGILDKAAQEVNNDLDLYSQLEVMP